MSAKQNDEHTHKGDDWTEEYLVWKKEMVVKPEVIYVSYLFILEWVAATGDGWQCTMGFQPNIGILPFFSFVSRHFLLYPGILSKNDPPKIWSL